MENAPKINLAENFDQQESGSGTESHDEKQRRAQEEISNRYHEVEGMFGSGERVVKGIMRVINHGVVNPSERS